MVKYGFDILPCANLAGFSVFFVQLIKMQFVAKDLAILDDKQIVSRLFLICI
jgi:hypothetical protein